MNTIGTSDFHGSPNSPRMRLISTSMFRTKIAVDDIRQKQNNYSNLILYNSGLLFLARKDSILNLEN